MMARQGAAEQLLEMDKNGWEQTNTNKRDFMEIQPSTIRF
jgi:hypothetical protein